MLAVSDLDEIAAYVFIDIAVIVIVARLMGMLFRRIRQPPVVGEIIAGILLGPTLLGAFPGDLDKDLFPLEVRPFLSIVAQLGLILFMFIVGLELDVNLIRGNERTAAVVSIASIVLPFGLGFLLAVALYGSHDIVGGENNGWAVAMTLLGLERGESAAVLPLRFADELARLLALAVERQATSDPRLRQRLAACYSQVQIMKWLGWRTLTKFLAGHHPGPDAAISKLFWSEYHRIVTELSLDVLGADAMAPSGRSPSSAFQTDETGAANSSASWVGTFLNARAGTIYAGSSQIQRNIIGEMVLGLPKEPRASAP